MTTTQQSIRIKIGPVAAYSIEGGIDVDDDEVGSGNEAFTVWGTVTWAPNRKSAWLDVTDVNGAVYRITALRDQSLDEMDSLDDDDLKEARSIVRSLGTVLDKLVAVVGEEAIAPEMRRLI